VKPATVRRFASIEIAWHWVQAVPYLVLVVTGTIILAERALGQEWLSQATLSWLHRGAGLALAALLGGTLAVALLTGHARRLGETLRDALSWRLRDIVWLVKVPLHALAPSIRLPPAGRLNPGQKLHTLAVVMLVALFIVTGVLVMAMPGALGPRLVHAALFVPAAAYLSVHLFLSLVNPPTRRGLGGIFFGHVSSEYAAAHHPLWVGEPDPEAARHALVSRLALVGGVAVLAAGAGLAVWLYGPGKLTGRAAVVWASNGWEVLKPGELTPDHACLLGASGCLGCHRLFEKTPSEGCLECHEKIGQALAERLGFHGTLTGPCRTCHTEHQGTEADLRPLDRHAFDHALARYPLEGEHQKVACNACHLEPGEGPAAARTHYIGLDFESCTDCHEDPHKKPPKQGACSFCHTTRSWQERKAPLVVPKETGPAGVGVRNP